MPRSQIRPGRRSSLSPPLARVPYVCRNRNARLENLCCSCYFGSGSLQPPAASRCSAALRAPSGGVIPPPAWSGRTFATALMLGSAALCALPCVPTSEPSWAQRIVAIRGYGGGAAGNTTWFGARDRVRVEISGQRRRRVRVARCAEPSCCGSQARRQARRGGVGTRLTKRGTGLVGGLLCRLGRPQVTSWSCSSSVACQLAAIPGPFVRELERNR